MISGEGINLSALGSFMGGGGNRNPGGQGWPGAQDGQGPTDASDSQNPPDSSGNQGLPDIQDGQDTLDAPDGQDPPGAPDSQDAPGGFGNPGGMPDSSVMQEIFSILQESGGQISDEVREKLLALGLNDEQIKQMADMSRNFPKGGFENEDAQGNFPGQAVPGRQDRAGTPGNTTVKNASEPASIILTGVLVLIIVAATILLARYKRRY